MMAHAIAATAGMEEWSTVKNAQGGKNTAVDGCDYAGDKKDEGK